jgi:error-prone DNA polymerase
MRLVKGISQTQVEGIESAQRDRPFTSIIDLAYRSGAARATLARLAAADAMRSLGLNRRQAVWDVLALGHVPPLLEGHEPYEPHATLPQPSLADVVKSDYEVLGLSLNAHPIGLVRDELNREKVQKSSELRNARQGQWIRVGGLVLVRQRPTTASGIVFCTLEDETGIANLVIRPNIYEKYRNTARGAVALVAEGRVERQGEVVHLQVYRLTDMSKLFDNIRSRSRDFH